MSAAQALWLAFRARRAAAGREDAAPPAAAAGTGLRTRIVAAFRQDRRASHAAIARSVGASGSYVAQIAAEERLARGKHR